jgi:hypothetical protein
MDKWLGFRRALPGLDHPQRHRPGGPQGNHIGHARAGGYSVRPWPHRPLAERATLAGAGGESTQAIGPAAVSAIWLGGTLLRPEATVHADLQANYGPPAGP